MSTPALPPLPSATATHGEDTACQSEPNSTEARADTSSNKPDAAATPPSLGSSESQSELDNGEGGRSRRHSPIVAELQSIICGEESHNASSADMFHDGDLVEFVPKLGIFGAPACRMTTSVMALIGILLGMVLASGGACILGFFIDEEPTIMPLGITLVVVGGLLTLIGITMWCSEFMCNDCLAVLYYKMREAPMKNAIKRKSRMAASRASNARLRASRCGSRSSVLTNGSAKTVSTKY